MAEQRVVRSRGDRSIGAAHPSLETSARNDLGTARTATPLHRATGRHRDGSRKSPHQAPKSRPGVGPILYSVTLSLFLLSFPSPSPYLRLYLSVATIGHGEPQICRSGHRHDGSVSAYPSLSRARPLLRALRLLPPALSPFPLATLPITFPLRDPPLLLSVSPSLLSSSASAPCRVAFPVL